MDPFIPFLMIENHDRSDDEIIRVIDAMYPDPVKRKEFINQRRSDERATLLTHSACQMDREKLMVYLLQNGADPNIPTQSGLYPIDYSDQDASRTMILLAYGANPNIPGRYVSTLYSMIYHNRIHISNALMTHGAQLKSGDLKYLKQSGRSQLFFDFYDNINLRRISLHYIRLEQIRSQ